MSASVCHRKQLPSCFRNCAQSSPATTQLLFSCGCPLAPSSYRCGTAVTASYRSPAPSYVPAMPSYCPATARLPRNLRLQLPPWLNFEIVSIVARIASVIIRYCLGTPTIVRNCMPAAFERRLSVAPNCVQLSPAAAQGCPTAAQLPPSKRLGAPPSCRPAAAQLPRVTAGWCLAVQVSSQCPA